MSLFVIEMAGKIAPHFSRKMTSIFLQPVGHRTGFIRMTFRYRVKNEVTFGFFSIARKMV